MSDTTPRDQLAEVSRRIPPFSGRMRTSPQGAGNTSRGLTVTLSGRRTAVDQPTRATEQWKPVVGYEGLYEVSNQGRVKSLQHIDTVGRVRKVKMLRPRHGNRSSDHWRVGLTKAGNRRTFFIHRLVLEAFVGPCPPGMEGLHYDDDLTNNNLSNLRWGSRSENMYDRVRNGRDHNARKTHCPRGHMYTQDNMFINFSGGRMCRTCHRERSARFRARKKEDKRSAA